jgi:hypothetical protein
MWLSRVLNSCPSVAYGYITINVLENCGIAIAPSFAVKTQYRNS